MISGGVAMERYVIAGGYPLHGSCQIGGAKNAALPILGASLLVKGSVVLHRIPALSDVFTMSKIMRALGVDIMVEKDCYILDSSTLHSYAVPEDLMGEMRSSIFLMGALLGTCGAARVSYPGGCDIGARPIDLHLMGLRALGAEIEEKHGYIEARAPQLRGAEIFLDFPSVGATENIMLAAVKARGETIIHNAAKEPEIIDLAHFLNMAGAHIKGAGSNKLIIQGVKSLHGIEYSVITDRIVTGTMILATAITGGKTELVDILPNHIIPLIHKCRQMGVGIRCHENRMVVTAPQRLKAVTIRTSPYPGFPTDLQAPMMSALTLADGSSTVVENIFNGRFKHVPELIKLGAKITISGASARIEGVSHLVGTNVKTTDLRAGAALVLAGLAAEGETVVEAIHHIDRGYQMFETVLQKLGAHIERRDFER